MKILNKVSAIFCSILLVAVFAISSMGQALAAQSLTVNRTGVMVSYIGENYKWAKFKTADGKVAYCMDLKKKWPEKSTNVTIAGEADKGVRYILENGYPYKSIHGNNDVDRFITQAALWWYLSDTGQTSALDADFTTNAADPYGLRDMIKKLVDEAKQATEVSKVSLNVNASNTNMNLSDDGQYFVSNEISVDLNGSDTYTVSVSGADGATTTDASGNSKTTFNAGEKFFVRIPANSVAESLNLKVTVTTTRTVNKAYILQPSDDSYQRLAALYPTEQKTSKSITLAAKMDKPRVCVDYVIVGDVRPNPDLTDPTPGKTCYDKGTHYTQENELTTRQENCKFNGWYTNEDLTGKWTDGTALNKDMTLYGAWECGTSITVPNTAASIPLIILGGGLVIIFAGAAIIVYRDKKNKKQAAK